MLDNLRNQKSDVPRLAVISQQFKDSNEEIFEQKELERWLQENYQIFEDRLNKLSVKTGLKPMEVINSFFQTATTLAKAGWRFGESDDGNTEEFFKRINWQKNLSELFEDYQKLLIALLQGKSLENKTKLSKIDKLLLERRLPYLQTDKAINLLDINSEDEIIKKIHKFFSFYRIKQAILLKENDAQEWLLMGIDHINQLSEQYQFTKADTIKVFFDKYGELNQIEEYLQVTSEQVEGYKERFDNLTEAYIKKAVIAKKDKAENYLKEVNVTMESVYDLINKKFQGVVLLTGEYFDKLNNQLKSKIKRYILGAGPTRSLQVIKTKEQLLKRAIKMVDWQEVKEGLFGSSDNLQQVIASKRYKIPKEIQPLIKAIFLGHSKVGNVLMKESE